MTPLDKRFVGALCSYAVLGILAGVTLEGKLRAFIWIFLGALCVKTYTAYRRQRQEQEEENE